MAAEMSSGMLALAQVYKRRPAVSMLVVQLQSNYFKKAVDTTFFQCTDGKEMAAAVNKAVATGEGIIFESRSIGKNKKGETVAEFLITWSFKSKSS